MINKKNSLRRLLFLLCLLDMHLLTAQVETNPPMRNVIGTTGGTGVLPSGNSIDFTVGETFIATGSNAAPFSITVLTQGFQQPGSTSNSLDENVMVVNSSCINGNNGSVSFQNIANTGPVTIDWNNNGPGTTSLFTNLAPGSYPYVITDGNFTITDTAVVAEDQVECTELLQFYTGITPNGDGHNDNWQIDGITNFTESHVLIYNRWGDLVWKGDNYNNSTVVWEGKNNKGKELPDATYFYLVEAGGKSYKGWVELTH